MSVAQSDQQAEPVLVIPGLDGDPRLLMQAAPRLLPGLRALPFDHQQAPVEGGMDELVERAVSILDADQAADRPALLCGESFGGTVALTIAHRHPKRVRGLVLLSTFGWYPATSARASRIGIHFWRLLGDRHASKIFRVWRPISVPGALGLRPPAALVQAYLSRHGLHLPTYQTKCQLSLHFDARPWIGEVTCPAFLLVGTWDPVVPTRAGRALARQLPKAELHCLPGGHLVHIVRAAEVGALIARWRQECCAEPPVPLAP